MNLNTMVFDWFADENKKNIVIPHCDDEEKHVLKHEKPMIISMGKWALSVL